MTDRIDSITIILPENCRKDDAEEFIKALNHFSFVKGIVLNIKEPFHSVAYQRARRDILEQIQEILNG